MLMIDLVVFVQCVHDGGVVVVSVGRVGPKLARGWSWI